MNIEKFDHTSPKLFKKSKIKNQFKSIEPQFKFDYLVDFLDQFGACLYKKKSKYFLCNRDKCDLDEAVDGTDDSKKNPTSKKQEESVKKDKEKKDENQDNEIGGGAEDEEDNDDDDDESNERKDKRKLYRDAETETDEYSESEDEDERLKKKYRQYYDESDSSDGDYDYEPRTSRRRRRQESEEMSQRSDDEKEILHRYYQKIGHQSHQGRRYQRGYIIKSFPRHEQDVIHDFLHQIGQKGRRRRTEIESSESESEHEERMRQRRRSESPEFKRRNPYEKKIIRKYYLVIGQGRPSSEPGSLIDSFPKKERKIIHKFLSEIGRRGGSSRRELPPSETESEVEETPERKSIKQTPRAPKVEKQKSQTSRQQESIKSGDKKSKESPIQKRSSPISRKITVEKSASKSKIPLEKIDPNIERQA
ncbi:unnamed protein product [Brachionus calyciflorus]|uniref:Uncharacterized protein n=1 Tax=Brachionus calyciflorus TaxID=104777 RepID=A0A814DAG3_9BILA|nr:unnamed protein product [Brachionus calyciflorus]